MSDPILFQEKQKFTQWWLWVILMGVAVIPTYGLYKQLILEEPFGNNPMPNFVLVILLFFILALPFLFWLMELRTEIDSEAIRFHYFPFFKRSYSWSEISTAEQINYGFVGGWGIRMGTTYGTVYNVSGNQGLYITQKSGKKFVIGTQKPQELGEVLRKIQLKEYN